MDELIEKLLLFTESANFVEKLSRMCCLTDTLLNEKAEKLTLYYDLSLFLSQTGIALNNSTAVVPGQYNPFDLLIEQVCETIMDAVKTGISVSDIKILTATYLHFLRKIKTITETQTLAKALHKILLDNAVNFSHRGLFVATQYLMEVVLCNHWIYHYLMSEEQEMERNSDCITVCPAPKVLNPLSSGCPAEEWQRQQNLLQREAEFAKDKKQFSTVHKQYLKESEHLEQTCDNVFDQVLSAAEGNEDNECLTKALSIVTQIETDNAEKGILLKVKGSEMDLEFEIDKIDIVSPRKSVKQH